MNKKISVGEFLDGWLKCVISGNVRQSTYTAYRGYIENHLKKHIGDERLCMLKAERLQRVVAELKETGGLASKTVRSIMLML